MSPPTTNAAKRIAAYVAFAIVMLLPRGLIGNPDVDVWNHVWGYGWVADALAHGRLPWHTNWLGAPRGGTLFFVDLPGAILALPLTWTFGAAVGFDAVLVGRVAAAGWFAHALCEEVSAPGKHGWVAGVAYATTPFLFCELANGITEVAATGWIPATLWLAARAFRAAPPPAAFGPRFARFGADASWVLLGAVGGACAWANFYYALTVALLVGGWWLGSSRNVRGACIAGAVALIFAVPAFAAIRYSVSAPDALVRRSAELNVQLMAHNAVDPRVYVTPFKFTSVDLEKLYGEPFRHTGYLRWSVLLLAGMVARRREARPWVMMAVASLVLGLGPRLWWGGDWVRLGGSVFSLPFGWLQRLVPDLAITHPLRLSIGAQAIVCVLAGWAVRDRPRWLIPAGVAVVMETLFASNATWPIPSAPTHTPAVYATMADDPDPRAVLDLPAEVGTTMATSRYFWFQLTHRHPVPWTPDARAGSSGDAFTFQIFPHPMGRPGERMAFNIRPLTSAAIAHLRTVYGWVVVHPDLEKRIGAEGVFEAAMVPAFGAATGSDPGDEAGVDAVVWWRL